MSMMTWTSRCYEHRPCPSPLCGPPRVPCEHGALALSIELQPVPAANPLHSDHRSDIVMSFTQLAE